MLQKKKNNVQQIQIQEHYKIIELRFLKYQCHKILGKIKKSFQFDKHYKEVTARCDMWFCIKLIFL